MSSLLNLMKTRSESRTLPQRPGRASIGPEGKRTDNNVNTTSMNPQAGKRRSELDHSRPRSSKSGGAATRSCDNGKPARRSTNQQRSAALASLYRRPGSSRASAKHSRSEKEDGDDGIIKCSVYPQMVGKRRSELIRSLTQPANPGRASTMSTDLPTNHATRRQRSEYRSRRCSIESDSSDDSNYETEDVLDDRPIRVCIYPQLKYCKLPGKMPAEPQQHDSALSSNDTPSSDSPSNTSSSQTSWNNTYRPGGLPHDEYRILVRRQQMQRVREMLEKHFAHRGNRQGLRVWHGLKQAYRIRQTERRRVSKIQYAVRKALKANFDLLSNDYELARHWHAGKVPYCELSDVDGVLLPQALINEFTRAFQDAQDDAYVPKLTPLPYGEPVQRTWIDERIQRGVARRRVDSGIAMEESVKTPQLVSKFSWDSDSDEEEEVCKRKRLTKVKR